MPKIDQLVDATVSHPRMSFLDAFQGYHQIPLAIDDQEKTAFVTPVGNYHYKVMPFDEDVRIITRKEYGDLYRRYGGEKQKGVGAPWRHSSCL